MGRYLLQPLQLAVGIVKHVYGALQLIDKINIWLAGIKTGMPGAGAGIDRDNRVSGRGQWLLSGLVIKLLDGYLVEPQVADQQVFFIRGKYRRMNMWFFLAALFGTPPRILHRLCPFTNP